MHTPRKVLRDAKTFFLALPVTLFASWWWQPQGTGDTRALALVYEQGGWAFRVCELVSAGMNCTAQLPPSLANAPWASFAVHAMQQSCQSTVLTCSVHALSLSLQARAAGALGQATAATPPREALFICMRNMFVHLCCPGILNQDPQVPGPLSTHPLLLVHAQCNVCRHTHVPRCAQWKLVHSAHFCMLHPRHG